MICILNCCKVIFGLIRHTAGHSAGAEATSADAFVPILIFVVLKANPDNLWSNVEYVSSLICLWYQVGKPHSCGTVGTALCRGRQSDDADGSVAHPRS